MDKAQQVFEKLASSFTARRLAVLLKNSFPGMGKGRAMMRANEIEHLLKPRGGELGLSGTKRVNVLNSYLQTGKGPTAVKIDKGFKELAKELEKSPWMKVQQSMKSYKTGKPVLKSIRRAAKKGKINLGE